MNRIQLIGYVGKDAEVRNGNERLFTTFSVATKESWKNAQTGQWDSRTEWHNCVANGPVGKYAGSLEKGAHVMVEGSLRSREYTGNDNVTRKVWEVRVDRVMKLDRSVSSDDAAEEATA